MNYKALILDHDDTVVDSTATVHYPAFVAYMEQLRGGTAFTLEDYFVYNFDPGVLGFFRDMVGLSEEEMREEERFWQRFVKGRIPKAYPGMREFLWEYKERDGILCVVSHSFSEYIRRDYAVNGLPEPDMIFGWEYPPEQRKPAPWPLIRIMETFGYAPEDLLVVDDLKPGYDMAKQRRVPFAAAGWAYDVPEIRDFMRENTPLYFETTAELYAYLFE